MSAAFWLALECPDVDVSRVCDWCEAADDVGGGRCRRCWLAYLPTLVVDARACAEDRVTADGPCTQEAAAAIYAETVREYAPRDMPRDLRVEMAAMVAGPRRREVRRG